ETCQVDHRRIEAKIESKRSGPGQVSATRADPWPVSGVMRKNSFIIVVSLPVCLAVGSQAQALPMSVGASQVPAPVAASRAVVRGAWLFACLNSHSVLHPSALDAESTDLAAGTLLDDWLSAPKSGRIESSQLESVSRDNEAPLPVPGHDETT